MYDAMRFNPPDEKPGVGNCPTHGEFETTMIQLPGSAAPMPGPCPECDVIKLSERRQSKARKKMSDLNRMMERSGIPKRFRDKSLNDYVPENYDQAHAFAVAKKYAANFSERFESAGCLVFIGPCGTGKTHLACGIGAAIINDGYSCMFTHVIEAIRLVRSTYRRDSVLTEAQAINRFTLPDLLIMDEIGMQNGTDNEFLILTELINLRYEDSKPTIMLSNLPDEKFEKLIGIRVFDRLRENGGMVLHVTGQSHRRKR